MLKLKRLLLLLAITTLAGCGGAEPEPPVVSLVSSPSFVVVHYYPVAVNLTWDSKRATRVVTSNFDTGGQTAGTCMVLVTRATSYHVTMEGPGGQATAQTLVWAIVR